MEHFRRFQERAASENFPSDAETEAERKIKLASGRKCGLIGFHDRQRQPENGLEVIGMAAKKKKKVVKKKK